MDRLLRFGLLIAAVALAAGAASMWGGDGHATAIFLGIGAGWAAAGGALAWDRRLGVAVTAAAGFGVALYLGGQHYASASSSVCNVNEIFNCDVVNRSAYSEIAGVSVALLGAGVYAGMVAAAVGSLVKPASFRLMGHLITLLAAVSVALSAYLAWASTQLGAWCLFCISLYGVNVLLLIGGLRVAAASGVPVGGGVLPAVTGKDDQSSVVFFVVALLVLMGATRSIRPAALPTAAEVDESGEATFELGDLYEATWAPVALDGTEPMLGPPDAAFTLVEFADFECPHCGLSFPELRDLVNKNSDLRVLFKHYPLDNACNPQIQRVFHKHSCSAAAAAECARQQGRFWELAGLMFKNQQYLEPEQVDFMAGQAGLDAEALRQCAEDPATTTGIQADIDAAVKLRISGTPSLFLQGTHGEDWVRITQGTEAVALLLDAKRKGVPLPQPHAPRADQH